MHPRADLLASQRKEEQRCTRADREADRQRRAGWDRAGRGEALVPFRFYSELLALDANPPMPRC